jgi:hypothetical protein
MKTNLVIQAPVFSISGYGAHSRDILHSLWMSQKFNMVIIPTGWGATSENANIDPQLLDIIYFCLENKIHQNADFIFMHVGIPTEFERKGKWNIGVTAGLEADYIPLKWVDRCNSMDMVIVPSKFEQKLFTNSGVKAPVYVVEEGVNIDVFKPSTEHLSPLDFKTDWNFLTGGQWLPNRLEEDRKQIGLLLKWFGEEFQSNPNVGLVMKTFTSNISSPDFVFTKERILELKYAASIKNPIYLIHGYMDDHELTQLYTHPKIKAFVSLTSGEGWGRMIAESVACDLPVLTTGWSAPTDFLSPTTSALFSYRLTEVPRSVVRQGIFELGMRWAMCEEKDAKKLMRRCYEKWDIAKAKAVEAGAEFRKNFNKEKTYEPLSTYVEGITKNLQEEKLSLTEV